MKKSTLYEYAILWHPTEQQAKESNTKSKIIVGLTQTLASTNDSAAMVAARDIPAEYLDQLDQVEIILRPF